MPASYWEESYQFSQEEIAIFSELQEELTSRKVKDRSIKKPSKQPLTPEELTHYNLPLDTGIVNFTHFYRWDRERKLKNLLSKEENDKYLKLKSSIDYKERALEILKTIQTNLLVLKETKEQMEHVLNNIERDASREEEQKSQTQVIASKNKQRKDCIKDWKEINDKLSSKIEIVLSEEYLIYTQRAFSNCEFISNHPEFEEYSLFNLRYKETLCKACERIKETLLLDWSLNSFNSEIKDENIKEMSALHVAKCKGPLLPFIKIIKSYSNCDLHEEYREVRLESLSKLTLSISNVNTNSTTTNYSDYSDNENTSPFTRISDICQVLSSEERAYRIIFEDDQFEAIAEKWLYHWLPIIRLSINKDNSKELLEFLQELSLSFHQGIQKRMLNVLVEYTKII